MIARRFDKRFRFLVQENFQDTDDKIAEYGDIYDRIEAHDGGDGPLAVNHPDHFVAGDAHTNSCENRHSFVPEWLAKFGAVSKHHLQGYLDFLVLLNSRTDWFSSLLGAESS